MITALKRRNRPRRGVTLVEMLVVVALVVLMMVILVQIFQSALGAMSVSRTTQELDVVLRSIDSMVRADLAGVTAKMTPPNDPSLKQGYFEYMENAPSDLQGEDTDDILAFTTKAPEGQVFTGRQWLSKIDPTTGKQVIYQAVQPATISSQEAEVLYFLRNGNLYRRVFLVAPDRKTSITSGGPGLGRAKYLTSMFGGQLLVSWLGMNDISCRPGGNFGGVAQPPIPNDLGDLTNRENRAFRPRFLNDFNNAAFSSASDGIPDDTNGDGVPDYYPTLYFNGVGYNPPNTNGSPIGWAPNSFVNENPNPSFSYPAPPNQRIQSANNWDIYAFPFIYPGMYSVPDPNRVNNALGWVHYMQPNATTGNINHSPLDLGETNGFAPGGTQTWWGFPTWRETMAGLASGGSGWTDPIVFLGTSTSRLQPVGLQQFNPTKAPTLNSTDFLPPVSQYGTTITPYGFDGAGSASFIAHPSAPYTLWQDDLILTNVRSFDVKAYDPYAPLYNTNVNTYVPALQNTLSAGYWDLGYAGLSPQNSAPYYAGNSTIYGPNGNGGGKQVSVPWQAVGQEPIGFGHEGRIPPMPTDFRPHPRRGYNIGDGNPGVIRLTHTFDTWSTDYVNAPDSDIVLNNLSPGSPATYPSFPPPYPSPLRGIQIQIRVTDPRNERTKVLTIRHDFTDKL